MGYYVSDENTNLLPIKRNKAFNTLDELFSLLCEKGWEEMTVFMRSQWNPNNKCEGQCNSTSLLVQEYFGGEIIRYPNPNGGVEKKGHYFNRINGVDIDLTSEQLNPRLTDYADCNKIANFGYNKFSCERAAYILKKNLGLA